MAKSEPIVELRKAIEHTLLKQEATREQIKLLCEEAVENGLGGVCVPPYFVADAAKLLESSGVKVVTVIGFPLGYQLPAIKVEEAKRAVDHGADELDMVMNIAAFKSGDINWVKNDIDSVATIAHMSNKKIKVIIESGILTDEDIKKACAICAELGVDFVKTSTGFAAAGASVAHVKLMRAALPKKIAIKASGGIRDKAFAEALIAAGADRIGTSSGVKIVNA